MSVFIDYYVRRELDDHLFKVGTQLSSIKERRLDLTMFSTPFTTADVEISRGEDAVSELPQDLSWVQHFLVQTPQRIFTSSNCGISRKQYQYGLWIKTPRELGSNYNKMVAGIIEEHFPNNTHLPLQNGDNLTVLKTYQQASVILDSNSGRFFNRVFVDCESYFNNNK